MHFLFEFILNNKSTSRLLRKVEVWSSTSHQRSGGQISSAAIAQLLEALGAAGKPGHVSDARKVLGSDPVVKLSEACLGLLHPRLLLLLRDSNCWRTTHLHRRHTRLHIHHARLHIYHARLHIYHARLHIYHARLHIWHRSELGWLKMFG